MGHRKLALGLAAAALLATGMSVGISQAQDASASPPAGAAPSLPHERGPGSDMHRFRGDGPGFHGPRGEMRGEMRRHMRHMRGARFEPGKHIEGRIAFLKAELKITDAQSRAWDQYAGFMRDTAKARQAAFEKRVAEAKARPDRGERRERKALLERLDNREQRAQQMLQSTQKRKAATEALYKALNDEQKKLAEDLL